MVAFAVSACASTSGPPSEEAKAYLDSAIALLEQKHINSANADWPVIRTRAHARIGEARTPADTHDVIREILAVLGEKHSFLKPPHPNILQAIVSKTAETLSEQRTLPTARMIEGKYGLVQLPQLNTVGGAEGAGRRYTDTLVSRLKELDRSPLCGWIVDLRQNGGGNMWPMLQGLDPLLGEEPFGYFVRRNSETTPWIRSRSGIFPLDKTGPDLKPSFELTNQSQPVAVLIGSRTASSGEMTALALIGRQRVRTFGLPSAGYTTANVSYPLSDGAFLVITESTVRDRSGKDYDGAIVPDHQVALVEAEEAAVKWLNGQCR